MGVQAGPGSRDAEEHTAEGAAVRGDGTAWGGAGEGSGGRAGQGSR